MAINSDAHDASEAAGGGSSVVAPQKRRFFQFNLRQILLLIALGGVLLGMVAPRIHQAFHWRRLREELEQRTIAEANLRAAVLNEPGAVAGRRLQAAVQSANLALARQALEAGADPNLMVDSSARTRLLVTCIGSGQIELTELLLDHGANIEQSDVFPSSFLGPIHMGPPLFAAIGCDQPPEVRCQMARLLIARGADPRWQDGHLNAMDVAFHLSDGQTGDLLCEYGLPYGPREMAAFNRLDELKQAVDQNPEILKQRFRPTWASRPGHGPTLLGVALERGYREMALFLIGRGAPIDVIEYQGSTLLHQAAKGGDPELIRLLVARGLEVDAKDDYGDTPLCDISSREKPEAVAALIEAGADVNRHGMNQRTPLHGAVFSGRLDIVEMLLAAGADPTLSDYQGETPLDVAHKLHPEIADLLEQEAAGH